ncbi:MAG: radical SAM protein [Terracidiphilus sp.]
MPPTFHIENFGCRAARADGEAIAALLRAADAAEIQPSEADVVIVNTCSVTAEADREARAYIRRAHRLNPSARIIATGCYAQRAPEELAAIPGVVAVIGNSHKAHVPEIALQFATASAHDKQPGQSKTFRADSSRRVGTGFSPYGQPSFGNAALAPENAPQVVTISALLNHPLILADDSFAHSFLEEASITPGAQTRPNLKIQEGCSNRCSFCVIPQTRGSSRSLPGAAVLSHVHNFVAAGGNELVLSGINLGRWGRDLGTHNDLLPSKATGFSPYNNDAVIRGASAPEGGVLRSFAALVRCILEQTSLPRLRLSSIEPMDWTPDLISLMAEYGGTRLARHAHLPLQSGSDSVLRRMHRRYRPWHYTEKVSALFDVLGPALTLGADVMVGFPGESDREFQETYDFIRSLPFGYLHLFPFSPRPGTRAWTLHAESPVPASAVNERMAALRTLAIEMTRTHRMRFLGAELDAITLNTPSHLVSAERTNALTENFFPVELSAALPANQLIRVRVTAIAADNTLLALPALSISSTADSRLSAPRIPDQPVLETAF